MCQFSYHMTISSKCSRPSTSFLIHFFSLHSKLIHIVNICDTVIEVVYALSWLSNQQAATEKNTGESHFSAHVYYAD